MSTFSDVASDLQVLNEGLRENWPVIKGHILSHFLVIVVLFGILGADLSIAGFHVVNPGDVLESPWFRLARETGLVYVLLIIPFFLASIYGSALNFIGSRLFSLLLTSGYALWFALRKALPQRVLDSMKILQVNPYEGLRPEMLVDLAMSIEHEQFSLNDLYKAAVQLMLKLDLEPNQRWKALRRSMTRKGQFSSACAYDFLTFLFAWCVLYLCFPDFPPARHNPTIFNPMLVMLTGLATLSLLKAYSDFCQFIGIQIFYASLYIRWDPDLAASRMRLRTRRRLTLERIEQLLNDERRKYDTPLYLAGLKESFRLAYTVIDLLA